MVNRVEQVRVMADTDLPDSTIQVYIDMAERIIASIANPYQDDPVFPRKYLHESVNIAVYMINKRGAEGQTAHSENGTSRTYGSADIPQELISRIVPHVGVI